MKHPGNDRPLVSFLSISVSLSPLPEGVKFGIRGGKRVLSVFHLLSFRCPAAHCELTCLCLSSLSGLKWITNLFLRPTTGKEFPSLLQHQVALTHS